jgi:dTDP-glucose 4,6-dehydratase/GDP-L-fucose synthase
VTLGGNSGEQCVYGYGTNISIRNCANLILSVGSEDGYLGDLGTVQDDDRFQPGDSDAEEITDRSKGRRCFDPPQRQVRPPEADSDLSRARGFGCGHRRPLTATVGGIGANIKNPGKYFCENAIIGIELPEIIQNFDIEKCIILETICSYLEETPVRFNEDNLFDGYPEETNAHPTASLRRHC